MTTFNNMENVPVKISEKYKPPPRVFQMPQAIANKLSLPSNHYHEAPQFCYDFQLERKVLAKIPEWRQMRQAERQARHERMEKREEQRQRAIEIEHKQLLGAVRYPSTEELSSSGSDEEQSVKAEIVVATTQVNSFDNILQPTILPRNMGHGPNGDSAITQSHIGNVINPGKPLNAFNYKDFEDDTSSPFDNIELKTINDLDILAQVLNNTQLRPKVQPNDDEEGTLKLQETKENIQTEHGENCNLFPNTSTDIDNSVNKDRGEQMAMNVFDYERMSVQMQKENIPNAKAIELTHTIPAITNSLGYQSSECTSFPNHHTNFMPYQQQQQNHHQQQLQQQQTQHQQHYANLNLQSNMHGLINQNYLYTTNCCNGGDTTGTPSTYFSPTHGQSYMGVNANDSYCMVESMQPIVNHTAVFFSPQNPQSQLPDIESERQYSKSKSVPDIIKELRDEVHNSERRRARNYSQTADDSARNSIEGISESNTPSGIKVDRSASTQGSQLYMSLEPTVQILAKNISSMGFPLERVAKIAKIFGADDKKIVEHLIPLSELMDLGFDESQISEALLKFDNNKEKALEYLIT